MNPWRAGLAAATAGALAIPGCTPVDDRAGNASAKENPAMTLPPSASRPSAPEVTPIEHAGIIYREDATNEQDGDQPGGYLAAFDSKTGGRLWRLKVYPIAMTGPVGPMGRYFRAMSLSADATTLTIENEAGGVYAVDLAARSARQIAGPPETAPVAAPHPKPQPPSGS